MLEIGFIVSNILRRLFRFLVLLQWPPFSNIYLYRQCSTAEKCVGCIQMVANILFGWEQKPWGTAGLNNSVEESSNQSRVNLIWTSWLPVWFSDLIGAFWLVKGFQRLAAPKELDYFCIFSIYILMRCRYQHLASHSPVPHVALKWFRSTNVCLQRGERGCRRKTQRAALSDCSIVLCQHVHWERN